MSKIIRGLVEDYYDIQQVRIQFEGQLRSYAQWTSEQEEVFLKSRVYKQLAGIEKDLAKFLADWLETEPIWIQWLKEVKGIGPILASGLIAWIGEIEPHQETFTVQFGKEKGEEKTVEKGFATISKLWAYAGLHVDEEGKAVRAKAGQKSNWNTRLKTHLWKIAESFVKTGARYRELYEQFRADYDAKWKTPEDCRSIGCKNKGKGKCMKGHRYAAAKRKMVKVFLAHYWQKARQLKGLPIESPFIIGRLGHTHEIPIIEK